MKLIFPDLSKETSAWYICIDLVLHTKRKKNEKLQELK